MDTKDAKIFGLKSHNCHVILKHLLTLALQGLLTRPTREALIELSMFLDVLGVKELKMEELDQIEAQSRTTLCNL